jgi:hypothetical protein
MRRKTIALVDMGDGVGLKTLQKSQILKVVNHFAGFWHY